MFEPHGGPYVHSCNLACRKLATVKPTGDAALIPFFPAHPKLGGSSLPGDTALLLLEEKSSIGRFINHSQTKSSELLFSGGLEMVPCVPFPPGS